MQILLPMRNDTGLGYLATESFIALSLYAFGPLCKQDGRVKSIWTILVWKLPNMSLISFVPRVSFVIATLQVKTFSVVFDFRLNKTHFQYSSYAIIIHVKTDYVVQGILQLY